MALIDKCKILRGDDIQISEGIVVHQPSLNEILDFGEENFFNTFFTLCSIPSDMKSVLWDAGLDFMKVSDFQLFIMLTRNMSISDTGLVIPGIDFSLLSPMQDTNTEEIVLTDGSVIVTESIYNEFISVIREMIGYVLKREKAGNKFTKQVLIDEDRAKRNAPRKDYESTLFPIVLSLVNVEEFPYTFENVFGITLYQLMKSFYQIQNKKSACALYQGSMSGFVDTSKINKSSFSWIYDETRLN